jgi:tRNA(fMet)-specific endonuclease VapC
MLEYILDTNICIYIIKQKPQSVLTKFSTLKPGAVAMSLITHAELMYSAERSQSRQASLDRLLELTTLIPVLPLETPVAEHYADIRARLSFQGALIGNNDLWIAAHVRALDKVLVTNNLREFERVEGLRLENWVV